MIRILHQKRTRPRGLVLLLSIIFILLLNLNVPVGASERPTTGTPNVEVLMSVSARDGNECRPMTLTDFNRPLLVGVSRSLFSSSWFLNLQARSRDPKVFIEKIFVDVLEKDSGHLSSFAKPIEGAGPSSHRLVFEIPVKGDLPEEGTQKEFTISVRVFLSSHRMYTISNRAYLLSKKDHLRLFDFNRSCLASLPPMIVSDSIRASQGGFYPQEIIHENIEETGEGKYVVDMSRYLSVGYYIPSGTDVAIMNGTPTIGLQLYPEKNNFETVRREFLTRQTFKIYQDHVGYIVATHARRKSPFQDLTFDSCGRLETVKKQWFWDEHILPAYALLVLPAAEEGRIDIMEEKLKDYPKYNTCKKGVL